MSGGPSDTWVVGSDGVVTGGVILHWDGATWSQSCGATRDQLHDVWGSGANDVWAIGGFGAILHWDGSVWSRWSSGTTVNSLARIAGSGANDVWVVGQGGTILHHR